MNIVVIREFGNRKVDCTYELDLTSNDPRDCTGCFTCWFKTPGRCIHKDMTEFYKRYLAADKVIIFSDTRKEFISGKLKTVLDRMIPLFQPYTEFPADGCNHLPRYGKYPDIEFYYQGTFNSENGAAILEDFVRRTFTQFRSKNIAIKRMKKEGGYPNENTCY